MAVFNCSVSVYRNTRNHAAGRNTLSANLLASFCSDATTKQQRHVISHKPRASLINGLQQLRTRAEGLPDYSKTFLRPKQLRPAHDRDYCYSCQLPTRRSAQSQVNLTQLTCSSDTRFLVPAAASAARCSFSFALRLSCLAAALAAALAALLPPAAAVQHTYKPAAMRSNSSGQVTHASEGRHGLSTPRS